MTTARMGADHTPHAAVRRLRARRAAGTVPRVDRDLFRTILLVVALGLVLWGFGLLLWPFLAAISWALCFVAVTIRPYTALARKWKKPRLAAFTMTFATMVGILAPLALAILLVLSEIRTLGEQGFGDVVERVRAAAPRFTTALEGFLARFNTDLDTVVKSGGQAAKEWAPALAGDVLGGIFAATFGLLVMLATQYFLYRDVGKLRSFFRDLMPMPNEDVDRIFDTLRSTTASALLGGLLVALLQGALGGVGLAIVGVRAPVTWAFVMAMCAFIPFGGTAIVWGPIAVYLFATGETGKAVFLVCYGALFLGTIDNFLRPWFLRKFGTSSVHPLLLFFAVLSGIALFGMSGILFGPILIAFLTTVTKIYRERIAPAVRADVQVPE
jgi:predicted PurR-regulated permease PerM